MGQSTKEWIKILLKAAFKNFEMTWFASLGNTARIFFYQTIWQRLIFFLAKVPVTLSYILSVCNKSLVYI